MQFQKDFDITKQIGQGSFSYVFEGLHKALNRKVAIKIDKNEGMRLLENEAYLLEEINSVGVPKLLWKGMNNGKYVIVQDLLGNSLQQILKATKRNFPIQATLIIGIKLVQTIQEVHLSGIIHRDIKPANIMFGRDLTSNLVYLIDFGLAKQFRHPLSGVHFPYKENVGFVGNYIFCSLNAINRVTQSRRDDIESILYIIIYLISGALPWITRGNSIKKLCQIKTNSSARLICLNCPSQILELLNYTRSLSFDSMIDYQYINSKLYELDQLACLQNSPQKSMQKDSRQYRDKEQKVRLTAESLKGIQCSGIYTTQYVPIINQPIALSKIINHQSSSSLDYQPDNSNINGNRNINEYDNLEEIDSPTVFHQGPIANDNLRQASMAYKANKRRSFKLQLVQNCPYLIRNNYFN